LIDAFRPVSNHLAGMPKLFKLFIDAQLLIAAQTTSEHTYALYGASALDLPRRGVAHIDGGIGGIAKTLTDTLRAHGAAVHFRKEVVRVEKKGAHQFLIHTKRGEIYPANVLIFNQTPWNIARLMDAPTSRRIRNLSGAPETGWGAFMVYVGLDQKAVPENFPLHHQVIQSHSLGEGNSILG
jgi:phytoene dehydrogenase-like protein